MTDVPSNLVPTRISQLTEYDGLSQDGYLPYVLNGVTYKVRFGNIASVGAVPSTRTITGGSGLAGGGDLSADRVIYLADGGVTFSKLADSGVVAGVYGSATEIPVLTVDQKGRVTVATTTPINLTNYVQTSRAILAGAGLTGGGTLAADRTLSINFSNSTPQPLGIPTAGTGTQAARDDHVHPAVDLSDTTETTGVLPLARGGTGSSLSPVAGAILYSDGSNIDLSNPGTTGQFLISQGTGAPDWVDLTGGTTGFTFTIVGGDCVLGGTLGVANGGTGAVTAAGARTNLLPSYVGNASKVLAVNALETDVEWVTGGGGGGSGTVTSVAMTVPTGLQVSGSPITTSGTLAVTLQSGYSIPTTASQANWDTAYSERLQWDGGSTGLVAATGRTSLGATTVGSNFFTLTNPSAITFPRINADNSVSALTATNFRTAIGAGTGDGTVTSVGGTGSVNGITLTGTVTSSGSLTLGGTLSNVSLTTQVTGTLPVGNGGTGTATTPTNGQLLIGNGTGYALSTLTAGSGVTITNGAGTITISATGGGSGTVTSVDASGGTTGLTFTGGPITTSGTLTLGGTLDVDNGGTGQTSYTDGQILIGNSTGNTLTKSTITAGSGISITNGAGSITIAATGGTGTVTSIDVSGGTTGLSFTGGPVTTSGTITMSGTLDVDNGGTGQTTYTDGQLLIGNSTGNTLTKATLTAGSGISITNGSGSITIAATGGGGSGTVTSVDVSGGTTGLTFSGGPITSSGTITMAGTLDADNGGTGISSYAVGDILYASTTTTLAKLADVATGNALISGGVSTAPSWGKIGLTTHVSGTLPVGNGGTGVASTPTNGQLLIGNGTGFSLATLTAGTNITITNSAGGITIDAAGGGGSLLGQTDSASPFETSLGYQAGNVNTGNENTFLGYQSGLVHTSGYSNTAVGYFSLNASTTGNYNVAMGSLALTALTTGQQNSAVGYRTLPALTTGNNNVAFGVEALLKITSNGQNTAVGTQSLTNLLGGAYNNNTGVGYASLRSQTSSSGNAALGTYSGYNITTGANNTVVGYNAANSGTNNLTTGSNNIIIGYNAAASSATVSNEITLGDANITSLRIPGLQAGKTTGDVLTFDGSKIVLQTPGGGGGLLGDTDSATPFETSLGFNAGNANTGVNNTFVGYQAGLLNSTGTDNAVLGYNALDANTTGSRNSAFGSNALGANISGNDNTAFGYNALLANTASGNTAFGSGALDANTTGTLNTAFGRDALGAVTTASENTAIGNQTLLANTTGSNNTAVGSSALQANTSGASNTAVGAGALNSNVNAGSCVAVGAYALLSQTGGSGYNTAVGLSSSRLLTTGNENITVGAAAGYSITTGSRNVLIGYNAGANTISFTTGANNIVIGHGADPSSATVSNEITLGNSSITAFRIPGLSVNWTANTLPYRNVPAVGTKTASYTLAVADVGKYVELSTGSDAVVPNSTFANGDIVSLFNNTSGNITITLNTTDAYIAGNNTNKGGGGTMTLATRGVASILFISGTLCVVSGNVS